MTDDTTREHHTIQCTEEDRSADVIVERDPKTGKVKGVHCDNPNPHFSYSIRDEVVKMLADTRKTIEEYRRHSRSLW